MKIHPIPISYALNIIRRKPEEANTFSAHLSNINDYENSTVLNNVSYYLALSLSFSIIWY